MALEYIREYWAYFHWKKLWRERSNCFIIIRCVEDTLIKHPDFALPGKKEMLKSNVECEILVIDGTETPCRGQKKAEKISFRKGKEAYNKDTSCYSKRRRENYMHFLC